MRTVVGILTLLLFLFIPLAAQELNCDITFTNLETLPAGSRDNLTDFIAAAKQYINANHWTQEDLGSVTIKCSFNISFQSATNNHYVVQAFIGSQRPIFKSEKNTAVVRLLDDAWEFDYVRGQPFNHNESRFDPLLSFLDFYAYIILGYDFDTYKAGDGTPYFQKASDIANRARGSASTGWDISSQGTYSRGQLIEELTNSKFRDFREADYRYHYRGLDLLYKDDIRARKNILSALDKIGKLRDKINQRSLVLRTFFETKYQEIAEIFLKDPDLTVYSRLSQIDPDHKAKYDEYSQKPR